MDIPRFVSLSGNERLDCFHLLAIVKNAAVNIAVLIGVPGFNSFGLDLEVELLDNMVILCLALEELLNCFPQWLQHFTLPPAMFEVSAFLTS